MTPLYVDLCRLADGRWIIRRYHSVVSASVLKNGDAVLPVEICADGSWVVSGWPTIRFAAILGFSPSDASSRQFEHVVEYLRLLRLNGCLPDIGPDSAEIVPVAEEHTCRLDPLVDLVENATCVDVDEHLRNRIGQAPNTSLAGTLCQHGETDLAFRFLRHCPQDVLPLAFVPIYLDMGTTQVGESCFQFLYETGSSNISDPRWPAVCAHRRVRINARGVVRVSVVTISDPQIPLGIARHLLTVDHSGELQPEETSCCQNVRIDRELELFSASLPRLADWLSTACWQQMVEMGIEDSRQPCEFLRDQVTGILRTHVSQVIQRMRTTLVQRAYPFDGVAREAAYSQYFVGADNAVVTGRREQTQLAMPLLSHCLRRGGFPKTQHALDHGDQLLPVFAEELGVPRWAASRLAKLPLPGREQVYFRMRGCEVEHLTQLAKLIEWLGPDCKVTRDSAGAYPLLARINDFFSSAHDNAIRKAFGHESEDVRVLVAALGRELNNPATSGAMDWEWVRDLAVHALPTSLYIFMARESIRHHLESNAISMQEIEPTLAAWLGRLSAKELMTKAQYVTTLCWLHRSKEMPKWFREAMTETVEAIIPAHTCSETGIQIVPLVSRLALANEGRRMHHCVGGYWGRVTSGEVLLFSLSDSQTESDATLCLHQTGNGFWQASEFKGRENADIRASRFLLAAERLCERLSRPVNEHQSDVLAGIAERMVPFASHAGIQPLPELSIQSFPEDVQTSLMALYPGAGSLEKRIEAARRKMPRAHVKYVTKGTLAYQNISECDVVHRNGL